MYLIGIWSRWCWMNNYNCDIKLMILILIPSNWISQLKAPPAHCQTVIFGAWINIACATERMADQHMKWWWWWWLYSFSACSEIHSRVFTLMCVAVHNSLRDNKWPICFGGARHSIRTLDVVWCVCCAWNEGKLFHSFTIDSTTCREYHIICA